MERKAIEDGLGKFRGEVRERLVQATSTAQGDLDLVPPVAPRLGRVRDGRRSRLSIRSSACNLDLRQ